MFLDERIIIQRGKIFRKLNVIAIMFALIYLFCRLSIYNGVSESLFIGIFSTEICTIICSLLVLLIGELYFKTDIDDERVITQKYEFYSKSGKFLLFAVIIGYSISMIFYDKRSIYDFPANDIIILLELICIVYLYYQFKKNNININYTFIENYNGRYYKEVFKKIGFFALITLLIYIVTGVISAILTGGPDALISFLIAAIVSIVVLGGHYILLSFIEKVDYDDQLNEVKNSFKIVTVVVFLLNLIYCIASIIYKNLVYDNISKNIELIGTVSQVMNNVSLIRLTYVGIYCAYLVSYFKDNSVILKSFSVYIISIIAIVTITVLLESIDKVAFYKSTLATTYTETKNALKIMKRVLWALSILEIISICLYGYFVLMLVNEKKYTFYLILLPMLTLIAYLLVIFIPNAKESVLKTLNIIYQILIIAKWGILSVVLIKDIKYIR
ncbi:MAG: hypothetical protein IJO27_02555 [Bacilli bacterium]|nr:hypothetical protein [Bacilli bacterium]